jgi:hypothetical protein
MAIMDEFRVDAPGEVAPARGGLLDCVDGGLVKLELGVCG